MRTKTVLRLAICSMMAGLYFALTYVKIDVGAFRITIASIIPIFVCLVFPFQDSLFICFIGVFLEQLLSPYGLTPTTPLWILPPLLRPLIISPVTYYYRKKGEVMEKHIIPALIAVTISSLCVSFANTGVQYIDSYIMDYPFAAALPKLLFQPLITLSFAIVFTIFLVPVIRTLRKAKVFDYVGLEKKHEDSQKNEE